MERNSIFAAVLLAGLVGMGSGIVADMFVPAHEKVHEVAFKIGGESAEASTAAAPAADEITPIAPLLASADVAAGEKAARPCLACHSFDNGGPNKVGPNNWGVVGAPMGHRDDFSYSPALQAKRESGGHWGYEELNRFLAAPRSYLPGTTMTFPGIKDEETRADLIAWLRTKADTPAPLPAADAAPAEDASPAGPAPAGEAAPEPSQGGAG
jgi:cytochrome c